VSVYRKSDGSETLVCDKCGESEDGTPVDSTMTKIDFTAEMLAAGFPQGTELSVTDTCPKCSKDQARRQS